jgi:putative AbiEi antitoxin of type IV toxin-antitoxin system
MTPDRRTLMLARRQHGVITRTQALDAGLSGKQIDARLASGEWRRLRRGVFALAATPSTFEQVVSAAILGVATPAWASRSTAARLFDLPISWSGAIELTIRPTARIRSPGLRVFRSLQLPAPDLERRHGIPITSPARTLVDLSSNLTVAEFGRLMDDAERRGLCRAESVARCIDRLAEAAGRNLSTVRSALALRLPGYGAGDSVLEQDALRALIDAGLPPPVRHCRVLLDGVEYEVDLAYPEWRIAIELLGYRYHGSRSAFDADSVRTRRFVLHGWTVLPFTSATPAAELAAEVSRVIERAS